jgi:predicted lysophospholipase L1 biosynthesis ABC-type transport system permease subunit
MPGHALIIFQKPSLSSRKKRAGCEMRTVASQGVSSANLAHESARFADGHQHRLPVVGAPDARFPGQGQIEIIGRASFGGRHRAHRHFDNLPLPNAIQLAVGQVREQRHLPRGAQLFIG